MKEEVSTSYPIVNLDNGYGISNIDGFKDTLSI